jgi:hypothetical protein
LVKAAVGAPAVDELLSTCAYGINKASGPSYWSWLRSWEILESFIDYCIIKIKLTENPVPL